MNLHCNHVVRHSIIFVTQSILGNYTGSAEKFLASGKRKYTRINQDFIQHSFLSDSLIYCSELFSFFLSFVEELGRLGLESSFSPHSWNQELFSSSSLSSVVVVVDFDYPQANSQRLLQQRRVNPRGIKAMHIGLISYISNGPTIYVGFNTEFLQKQPAVAQQLLSLLSPERHLPDLSTRTRSTWS